MPIITLTSDLGDKDFYLAAVKGFILSSFPDARLVDITHTVPSFNVIEAAFTLGNAYKYFPEGTVHLVSVDNSYQKSPIFVAVQANGHFFVAPDNGILSLFLKEQEIEKIVKIQLRILDDYIHFPIKDIMVKSAVHLAKGGKMEFLGRKINGISKFSVIQPVILEDTIRGNIVYIDAFKNAITNVDFETFERIRKGRKFSIIFKRNEVVEHISKQYSEVDEGEKLCLFGITGFLEVAINKGKAADLLGLEINEVILINFK
jgi:S-adenosyl-L-methionine hydrolase (adenosine-forming)